MIDIRTVASFVKEITKLAGEGGYYVSFFTGERRKDATFFPPGAMNLKAEEILELAKKKEVAPAGLGSANRFLAYYKNRAGKQLKPERRAEIDKAIQLIRNASKEEKRKDK